MTISVPRTASLRMPGVSGNQSVSFGSLPAAGSAIVVKVAAWCSTAPAGTCSDNQGNTYSLIASKTDNGSARQYAFLAENIGTPSGTFTVTVQGFVASSWGHIGIAEVAGAATSSAFDVSASNGATSSSNPASASSGTTATTALADAVAFATLLVDGGTNPTGMALPSGYTNLYDEENGASYLPSRTDYMILSATGAQSASWGSSINPSGSSGRWSGLIVVIKGTSGGGASVAPGSDVASRRNRPGHGPYSHARYFRPALVAFTYQAGGQSYDVTIAETGTAADSLSAQLSAVANLAEAASAADAISAALSAAAGVAETASATDSVSGPATFQRSVGTEAASAADSLSSTVGGYDVTIAETAAAADSLSALLNAAVTLAETGSAADTVSSLATLLAALTESVSASDIVSTGGATYAVDFAEAATAVDSLSALAVWSRSVAEAGSATDATAAQVQFAGALAEAVTALEVVTAGGILGVTITETAAATDSVSAPTGFGEVPPERVITIRFEDRTVRIVQTRRPIKVLN